MKYKTFVFNLLALAVIIFVFQSLTFSQTVLDDSVEKEDCLYLSPRFPGEFISKLNELGAKGYKLEATVRGESNSSPEYPYQIPIAALVKLDEGNIYEYDFAIAYYPGELLSKIKTIGKYGFYFSDQIPVSGTDESEAGDKIGGDEFDRVFRDFNALILNRKPDNGNIFIFERKNKIEKNVEFKLITGDPSPGSSARDELIEQINANTSGGFIPAHIFYIGPNILQFTPVPAVLLQKTEQKPRNSDEPEIEFAIATAYKFSGRLNEAAKMGFRLDSSGFELSLSSKIKNDNESYEYSILIPGRKTFHQQLKKISQTGSIFRTTGFRFLIENRLFFEKNLKGNQDRFEYRVLKMDDYTNPYNKKDFNSLPKIIEERKQKAFAANQEYKKQIEQGFSARDLFYSKNAYYVLFERLQN